MSAGLSLKFLQGESDPYAEKVGWEVVFDIVISEVETPPQRRGQNRKIKYE